MTRRFAWRLAIVGPLALVGVLALLLGAVYGGLQTETGRRLAVPALERGLSTTLDSPVAIEGLSEVSLDGIRLDGLVVGSPAEPWLRVTSIDVTWRPLALLGGRLDIPRLNVGRLNLYQPPPSDDQAEGAKAEDLRLPITVSIGKLAVQALELGAPVLGEAAILAIDGEARAGEDGSGFLRLETLRRDGPGGRLTVSAEYALQSRRLDLDLSLQEPQGGLVAGLLNLPNRPAVSATLTGEGSLDGWQGQLKATADGLTTLESGVDIVLGPRLLVALDGAADIAAALPEALRRLAAPKIAFTVKAHWDPGAEERHALDARVASDAADALLRVSIDGRTLMTGGQVVVRLRDPALLAPLTAPVGVQSAEATVTIEGTLTRPTGRLDARVENLSLPGVTSEWAALAADYDFPQGLGGPATVAGWLRLVGTTLAEERLKALVGDDVRLEADGRIMANGDVEVKSARLRLAGGEAALSGTFAADGRADFASSLDVPDLALLQSLLGMPVGGSATATAGLRLAEGATQGAVTFGVQNLALPEAEAAAGLLGSDLALAADIKRDATGNWQIDSVSLDAGAISAAGRAFVAADLDRLDGAYRLRLADLSPLGGQAGVELTGNVTLDGTVTGAPAAPSLRGRLTAQDLQVARQPWRDFGIDYHVDEPLTKPRGRLDGRVQAPWDWINFSVDLAPAEVGQLAIRNFTATTLGSRLTGDVVLDFPQGVAEGRLSAKAPDLKAWSTMVGLPLAGAIGANLNLVSRAGRQNVALDIDATQLRIAPAAEAVMTADGVTARLAIDDALGERRVDGRIHVAGLARQDMRLSTVEGRATGRPDRLDISFAAMGDPLTARGAGRFAVTMDALEFTLDSFSATAQRRSISLEQPARLYRAGEEVGLQGLRMRIGDGAMEGDLRLGGGTIDLTANLRRLPLSLVDVLLPKQKATGTLDGEVRLTGLSAAPDGQLRLSTAEATVEVAGEPLAVSARAEGTLIGGKPALRGSIEGPGGAALEIEGRLPVRISAAPFAIAADPQPFTASLRGRGSLAVLLGPMVPDPHRLTGRLDLMAELSGSLADPRAEGSLRIEGGRYENLLTGTLIREIALQAEIEGSDLRIARASGLAGTGRIEGSGALSLNSSRSFPLEILLKAEKAGLVDRDDLTATISGEVDLRGPVQAPAIKGNLTVDEAEVLLVDDLPPEVVTLDVIEVNLPSGLKSTEVSAGPAAPGIALDLSIAIPNRLFVRGRGLDSEWAGAFRLTGSAAEPKVAGEVKPVRGQVAFAGKSFGLQQGSTVAFRDPASTIPVLDITAEHRGSGFIARFLIRGPADNPEITLSSVPDMPQDEIVSRVLFGRGVSRISAIEAAQLAQTMASLSGKGGLGILDTARRALGVDVLRVESGEEERGPAVAAGRYLSKDVYVGVRQGTGAKSGAATVEIEVVPNVTVETDVGPTSGNQIGARWKLDY